MLTKAHSNTSFWATAPAGTFVPVRRRRP